MLKREPRVERLFETRLRPAPHGAKSQIGHKLIGFPIALRCLQHVHHRHQQWENFTTSVVITGETEMANFSG